MSVGFPDFEPLPGVAHGLAVFDGHLADDVPDPDAPPIAVGRTVGDGYHPAHLGDAQAIFVVVVGGAGIERDIARHAAILAHLQAGLVAVSVAVVVHGHIDQGHAARNIVNVHAVVVVLVRLTVGQAHQAGDVPYVNSITTVEVGGTVGKGRLTVYSAIVAQLDAVPILVRVVALPVFVGGAAADGHVAIDVVDDQAIFLVQVGDAVGNGHTPPRGRLYVEAVVAIAVGRHVVKKHVPGNFDPDAVEMRPIGRHVAHDHVAGYLDVDAVVVRRFDDKAFDGDVSVELRRGADGIAGRG